MFSFISDLTVTKATLQYAVVHMGAGLWGWIPQSGIVSTIGNCAQPLEASPFISPFKRLISPVYFGFASASAIGRFLEAPRRLSGGHLWVIRGGVMPISLLILNGKEVSEQV